MPTSDLNTYLEESYSIEAISNDISDLEKHFLVATTALPSTDHQTQPDGQRQTPAITGPDREGDEKLIGFVQLTEGTTDPCLTAFPQTSLVELQRLYVSRDAQGLGVGKRLTKEIESKARDMGYRHMWLGVWEGNFIAQRVYESMGFERVGEHEFRMGRCIQTDWIMVKEL